MVPLSWVIIIKFCNQDYARLLTQQIKGAYFIFEKYEYNGFVVWYLKY